MLILWIRIRIRKHISTGAFRAGDGAEFHNSGGDTSTEYSTHPEAADTVHNATIMESPTSIGSVEMPQVAVQVFGIPARWCSLQFSGYEKFYF
jgi:hypothetical protein